MRSATRTRIVATIGPACAQPKILEQMIREGVSVFRFNFSHGTRADHERYLERVQAAERKAGHRVGILQDLEGHRIRTGRLAGGRPVALKAWQHFALHRQYLLGDHHGVSIDYPGRFTRIHPRQKIFIDDGKIHLEVLRAEPNRLTTQVIQEGTLGEHKGVNIPGAPLDFPPINPKDVSDLEFGIRHRVDYVAQSFVRNAADVLEVKSRLRHLPRTQVIAKVESREGIQHIAGILKAADGIMVARGDLGISVPIYEIPILQKWIIAACNHRRKVAITATQMLEHMIDHPMPTRAEVTDVANAVIDGSDFVMLSGETATGRYPVEAVRMMHTIIQHTERHAPFRGVRRSR
jgi:pyruvate kinase